MTADLRDLFFSTGAAAPADDEFHTSIQRAKYQRLRQDYRKFCNEIVGLPRTEQPLWQPPPTVSQIKAFLTYYARTKIGVLEAKCTVRTICNDWQNMERDILKHTAHRYKAEEREEITSFVEKKLLRDEGLSTKARPKTLADSLVIRDLLEFLWRRDESRLVPRVRVQIATALCFLWFTGLRTGELLESRGSSQKNEGILWKDIRISLVQGEDKAFFHAQVAIRNRKGKKGREDSIDFENLREDPCNRWRCPLTLILGLAIEDGAIDGIHRAEDLASVGFSAHSATRELRIRREMREIPVLRRRMQGGGLSKDQILYGATLAKQLRELGHRAGYVEDLVPYSVRRGFGNGLDKHLTEAERSRHFGHQNAITFQHYLSRVAPCDVQSILNGDQPDQAIVDFFRSMRSKVDREAPKPPRSSFYEPRYRSITEREQRIGAQYRLQRKDYFARREEEDELSTSRENHHPFNETLPRAAPTALFQNVLRYDKDRSRIIDVLYGKGKVEICLAVEAVVRLLKPTGWSYPSGRGAPGSQFCYMCAEVVPCGERWRDHCREHIDKGDKHCGQISQHGIILWPGICPFCLGREELAPEERLHQWRGLDPLLSHLEIHLRGVLSWPLVCPHPRCSVPCVDVAAFWEHMSLDHGVSPGRTCSSKTAVAAAAATEVTIAKATEVADPSSQKKQERLTCATCQQTLLTLEGFLHHTNQLHVLKRCPKEGCLEVFRPMCAFKNHLLYHCGLSTYVCDLNSLEPRAGGSTCGKLFGSAVKLRKHKESHVRSEKLRCPVPSCGLIFRKDQTLKNHKQSVHRGRYPTWNGPDAGSSRAKRNRSTRGEDGNDSCTTPHKRTRQVD